MADEGPNDPQTAVDDATVGTVTWNNPTNCFSSDNSYATAVLIRAKFADVIDASVKIVKSDDTLGSEDKADTGTAWPTTDTYASYGASDDLWDESWDYDDINSSNFGVVISAEVVGGDQSHYLKATNFGFSIPAGATINGILVEIERRKYGSTLYFSGFIDHIRITVYYTEGAAGTNITINVDDAYKDVATAYVNVDDAWKEVDAVYVNKDDAWKEVTS